MPGKVRLHLSSPVHLDYALVLPQTEADFSQPADTALVVLLTSILVLRCCDLVFELDFPMDLFIYEFHVISVEVVIEVLLVLRPVIPLLDLHLLPHAGLESLGASLALVDGFRVLAFCGIFSIFFAPFPLSSLCLVASLSLALFHFGHSAFVGFAPGETTLNQITMLETRWNHFEPD